MKLNYFPETDSLYIDLSEKPSVESQQVSAGVVLDCDAEGNLAEIAGYGVASKHLTFRVELFSILLGLLC